MCNNLVFSENVFIAIQFGLKINLLVSKQNVGMKNPL